MGEAQRGDGSFSGQRLSGEVGHTGPVPPNLTRNRNLNPNPPLGLRVEDGGFTTEFTESTEVGNSNAEGGRGTRRREDLFFSYSANPYPPRLCVKNRLACFRVLRGKISGG